MAGLMRLAVILTFCPGIIILLANGVCETLEPLVAAPSFEDTTVYYSVRFDNQAAPVVQNVCQGTQCLGLGQNNIASVTMQENGAGYTPITVVVEKTTYDPNTDGTGWNIRPTHLVEDGIVTNVDDSALATSRVLSFIVTAPCQLSVELGDETVITATKESYLGFAPLILAFNPPESSWPQQKPDLSVDLDSGEFVCTSAVPGRQCVVAQANYDCSEMVVAADTDLYFTSRQSSSFRWGDGCGNIPKLITLQRNAIIFLDDNVVVFARVASIANATGVIGYGVLSNYYMGSMQDTNSVEGIVKLGQYGTIFGPILLDSTYRNIISGRSSTIAWTKSFAWELLTDGVTLYGVDSLVTNNFFKVNGDVLKPYQNHVIYQNNTIWHQMNGSAVILSWGNWRDNQADRNGTTQVLDTSIIHDYRAFEPIPISQEAVDEDIALQSGLVDYGALISAQHSMPNAIGSEDSPLLVKNFRVEGKVGVVMAVIAGYTNVLGLAPWQENFGCVGDLHILITDLNLTHVRSYAGDSAVTACNKDFSESLIPGMKCGCESGLGCYGSDKTSRCRLDIELKNLIESKVNAVPSVTISKGRRTWLTHT